MNVYLGKSKDFKGWFPLNSCHVALALKVRAGRGSSYDGILITLFLVMGVVPSFYTFPVLPALSGLLELFCDVFSLNSFVAGLLRDLLVWFQKRLNFISSAISVVVVSMYIYIGPMHVS